MVPMIFRIPADMSGEGADAMIGGGELFVQASEGEVVLPDGKTVDRGTLDAKGKAKLIGISTGDCQISFPELDGAAWEDIQ